MATLQEVLNDVDGLRSDAARRVRDRFKSVDHLAAASVEELTRIKGIGDVMARRIQEAAQAAKTRAAELPTTAKNTTARAADAADRAIGTASGSARTAADDVGTRARTGVHRLHAKTDEAVDRTASTVGRARARGQRLLEVGVGLTVGAVKLVTAPARVVLRRLTGGR